MLLSLSSFELEPDVCSRLLEGEGAARKHARHLDQVDPEPGLEGGQPARLGGAHHTRGKIRAVAAAEFGCVRAFARSGRPLILTADDLGPGRLFLASSSRAEAERFADDALGALMRADAETRGDLLHTLEVFFDSSRSVRRAAEQLAVHENTIRYRLARIRELTGLAVGTDSSDELTAHLALLVLRLRRLAGDPDVP